MDNIREFGKYINNIYNKAKYLDHYGGSVVITGVTLFVFFLIFSYIHIQSRIKPIRADWINQRCSPAVIPFAGWINKDPDSTPFEYTASNFQSCLSQILSNIISFFLAPLNTVMNSLVDFFNVLVKAIQSIRKLFASIRTSIMSIVSNIMHRIMNILIQLQYIMIKLKAILGRVQATLTASLFTTLGTYLAMKSFMGAFLELIIMFLIALAIAVGLSWIFFLDIPFAIAGTILIILITIPFAIIAGSLNHILDLTTSSALPTVPGCFDENTLIPMAQGTKAISTIHMGDTLSDGGIVTAIFKITSQGKKMYHLRDIIMTGCHSVLHSEKGWIPVSQHPEAIPIDYYAKPFVYCLNTTTKKININHLIFLDWDEMDELDFISLKNVLGETFEKNPILSPADIHFYMESGFHKDTLIELEDGRSISIIDVRVNDELRSGDRILGIVKMDGKNVYPIKKYSIANLIFIGGPNLRIKDKYLGEFSTMSMEGENVESSDMLYHIITDTGFLTINGIRFFDYNGGLEQVLWKKEHLSKIF
jgi:hypothetical protein